MHKIVSKQKESESMIGSICTKIKKLEKFIEWLAKCRVEDAGNGIYHVTTTENREFSMWI
jgi:hypothetical protein